MKHSRRKFVRTLGLAGVAATQLPSLVKASEIELAAEKLKLTEGMTVLFQGDSITDGNRTRNNDWNHLMGHGYVYLISSRLWYDYPEKKLSFINRGVSGDRVRDLEARWQKEALDLKPDVLSILVGINDVIAIMNGNDPESMETFEKRFRKLLDRTKTALPDTKLVLIEPFILPVGWVKDDRTEVWQKEVKLRQELTKQLAADYGAIFLELQQHFNDALKKAPANYWIWDGIHPMPAGHEMMSRLWIDKVFGL